MITRTRIAFASLALGVSSALLASQPIGVELSGTFNGPYRVRLEKVGEQKFVVLPLDGRVEETRLRVEREEAVDGSPDTRRLVAVGKARKVVVQVNIPKDNPEAGAVLLHDGDRTFPVRLEMPPKIVVERRAYYNRSRYLRLESISRDNVKQDYLVLHEFNDPTEIRLPHVSTQEIGEATQTRYAAGGRVVVLRVTENEDVQRAAVSIDSGPFQPLTFVEE